METNNVAREILVTGEMLPSPTLAAQGCGPERLSKTVPESDVAETVMQFVSACRRAKLFEIWGSAVITLTVNPDSASPTQEIK